MRAGEGEDKNTPSLTSADGPSLPVFHDLLCLTTDIINIQAALHKITKISLSQAFSPLGCSK